MSFVERLGDATEEFHDISDGDALRLLGDATAESYRRYLAQMYGFVCPLERAIVNTPAIDRHLDLRKFQKHELLRRDLSALHMSADQIARLPQCAIPRFGAPEEALGWAYPVERSALRHGDLFRRLAAILPGEVAFASSYLKCYFSAVGETWREFGRALDPFEDPSPRAAAVLGATRAAFRRLSGWRFLRDERRKLGRTAHLAPRIFAAAARQRDLLRAES